MDDSITGDGQNNVLAGGAGSDVIMGGLGNDSIYGDWVTTDPQGRQYGVLQQRWSDSGHGVEGNDTLRGGAGDDLLVGNSGNDELDGGQGADTLTGDGPLAGYYATNGIDTFVLRAGDGGSSIAQADVITDFQDGVDVLGLAAGLNYSNLVITQGNGTDTATANTVIKTSSGEYLAVVRNVSTVNLNYLVGRAKFDFQKAPCAA